MNILSESSCIHYSIGVAPGWAGASSTVALARGFYRRVDGRTQVQRVDIAGVLRMDAGVSWDALAQKVQDAADAANSDEYPEGYSAGSYCLADVTKVPRAELVGALKVFSGRSHFARVTAAGDTAASNNGVTNIPRMELLGKLDSGLRRFHLNFLERSDLEREARAQLEAMTRKAPSLSGEAFSDDPEDLGIAIALAYWQTMDQPRVPGASLRTEGIPPGMPRSRWQREDSSIAPRMPRGRSGRR